MALEDFTTRSAGTTPFRHEPARLPDIAPKLNDAFGKPERHRRPGGSTMGRLMRRSRTRTAGIRFEWAMRSCGPVLRVVATWTDRQGQPHHTSYSVQCNGLEGALDRAIASRISCGAPLPDRQDLLQRLQQEFATSPHSHANTSMVASASAGAVEQLAA